LLLGRHAVLGESLAHGVVDYGRLRCLEVHPFGDNFAGPLALAPGIVESFDRRLENFDKLVPRGFNFFLSRGQPGLRNRQYRPHVQQPAQPHFFRHQVERRRNHRRIDRSLLRADHSVVGRVQWHDDGVRSQTIFLDEHTNFVRRESAEAAGADPFAGQVGDGRDLGTADENMLEFYRCETNDFERRSARRSVAGPPVSSYSRSPG
jgi:hypothetical protein